jgi:Fic family protein
MRRQVNQALKAPRTVSDRPQLPFAYWDRVSTKPLSIEAIEEFHRVLLGNELIVAGQFRSVDVEVGQILPDGSGYRFRPPPPSEVVSRLNLVLSAWNERRENPRTTLSRIAELHYGLLEVHPFYDGNGDLARAITLVQARSLFGKDLTSALNGPHYLRALKAADEGNLEPLNRCFQKALDDGDD